MALYHGLKAEVYSPNGKCNQELAAPAATNATFSLVYYEDKILACISDQVTHESCPGPWQSQLGRKVYFIGALSVRGIKSESLLILNCII